LPTPSFSPSSPIPTPNPFAHTLLLPSTPEPLIRSSPQPLQRQKDEDHDNVVNDDDDHNKQINNNDICDRFAFRTRNDPSIIDHTASNLASPMMKTS
jgi:hypothetical protein